MSHPGEIVTLVTDDSNISTLAADLMESWNVTELTTLTTLTRLTATSATTAMTLRAAISPFNLSHEMSKVVRLLLLAGLAVIGSVGNIFMISSVVIEDNLNKRGNAFLVNTALADLLVTLIVIPASAVIILAGMEESYGICNFQWFLVIVSLYVSVLTVTITAAENYARLCLTPECYAMLTPSRITTTLLVVWIISSVAVALQFVYHIGPDYCLRQFDTVLPYHVIVAGVFFSLPDLVSFSYYIRIILCVRAAQALPSFKPPGAFLKDYALMYTNLYSLILFTALWSPLIILICCSISHSVPNRAFDNLTSLALSKSCINCFLYCLTNRHFRNAYVNLFHYCCCKTTVSFTRRTRGEPTRPSVDVRVHIIPGYNMYSYTSPQRANREASSNAPKRFVGTRPATSRTPSREVYEL